MATESIKYVAPEVETKTQTKIFPRPGQHTSGVINWLTTIDHKKIGVMYKLVSTCDELDLFVDAKMKLFKTLS